jgi:hypothetical protein
MDHVPEVIHHVKIIVVDRSRTGKKYRNFLGVIKGIRLFVRIVTLSQTKYHSSITSLDYWDEKKYLVKKNLSILDRDKKKVTDSFLSLISFFR